MLRRARVKLSLRLVFTQIHVQFVACESLVFPSGRTGDLLRGGFGKALKSLGFSPYEMLFRRRHETGGAPAGMSDPPRPFVFRIAGLDGSAFNPGDRFEVPLHLFDSSAQAEQWCRLALSTLFGPRAAMTGASVSKHELTLAAHPGRITRARVDFLTPTELKERGGVAATPEFRVLFTRARDRIGALAALYGDGPLSASFTELSGRAATVRLARAELARMKVVRRSSSTRQVHSIGGFTGWAAYEGDLDEFLPWLRAAEWTGVGRHTAWGNGQIQVATPSY